jgi:hypothetical protein
VQNRKYLIYFGSQKTRTEFHNGSFGSVSSVSVLGYFGSVPRFRFFLPTPSVLVCCGAHASSREQCRPDKIVYFVFVHAARVPRM